MEWLRMQQWSPYVVGIGIGVLSWLTFVLSDKPIGCSTAFARFSGMIERVFRGDKTLTIPLLSKGEFGALTLPEVFKVNAWVVLIPAAVVLTALLFALEHFGW